MSSSETTTGVAPERFFSVAIRLDFGSGFGAIFGSILDLPKSPPRPPKSAPRAPKSTKEVPQERQRAAQETQRSSQDAPKRRQETPKRLSRSSNIAKESPKRAPSQCAQQFSLSFRCRSRCLCRACCRIAITKEGPTSRRHRPLGLFNMIP